VYDVTASALVSLLLVGFRLQAQTPPAPGPVRPSPAVSPPRVVDKVEPEYTDEARRAWVNAIVLLYVEVRADATPANIRVVRSAGFGLDEMAIEAVNSWRFAAGVKEGKPVTVAATIEVNFHLMVKGHESQHARLNFTLPAGAARPELMKGKIPDNSGAGTDERIQIGLTVRQDGKPENLMILKSTNENWARHVLHELKGWRFRPATLNGGPAKVEGVFELTVGRPK